MDATVEGILAEVRQSVEVSEAAALRAREAEEAARQIAGDGAASAIGEDFATYASQEARTAHRFRVATLAFLGVIIAVAVVFVIVPIDRSAGTGTDWQAVIYRVAAISGLAALSAYLGRQSGHHRKTAQWAGSIAVQLKSWSAFLQPVRDEKTKAVLYEIFTRRVMGPPPESPVKGGETTNPLVEPLLSLATRLAPPK